MDSVGGNSLWKDLVVVGSVCDITRQKEKGGAIRGAGVLKKPPLSHRD